MALAVLRLAGPGADISFAPLRSAMVSALKPLRTTNCSIFQTLVWLLSAIYIATPGFFTLALRPSRVTSTAETSIWLVIMAATFGGPPISLVISGSMFCSLKKPRSGSALRLHQSRDSAISSSAPVIHLTSTCRSDARQNTHVRARNVPVLFVQFHDRDHRTAAMWSLVHGIDRYKYRGVADRKRGHTPYRRLRMPVMVDVGIIQHDLPPPAQHAPAVRLAFHEAIDDTALEVFRPRPFRQLDPGVANRIVDAVDIERIAHDRMADPVTAAGAGLVAEQDDLRLGQFHAGRTGGDGGI